jgi:hypothetical protein
VSLEGIAFLRKPLEESLIGQRLLNVWEHGEDPLAKPTLRTLSRERLYSSEDE